jgi:hypothetical protein
MVFGIPVITMSTLGSNGRFGNQLFQYAFLKIYGKRHHLQVETPLWIGQYLFGHQDPPITRPLPMIRQYSYRLDLDYIANSQIPFKNVDFWGYFQYHTSYYAPEKEYFRSLFKPVPAIEARMGEVFNRLRAKGKTLVGLHLRRGDYGTYGPNSTFFIAPSEWYKEWLRGVWDTLDEPVLFIASDEPDKVLGDFAEFHPVTSNDIGGCFPEASFYPDFYILSHCDLVAISNSSFSFAACMLNEQGKLFVRPYPLESKLIPFDPWNSDVLIRPPETIL